MIDLNAVTLLNDWLPVVGTIGIIIIAVIIGRALK